jgi:hypothetical protein
MSSEQVARRNTQLRYCALRDDHQRRHRGAHLSGHRDGALAHTVDEDVDHEAVHAGPRADLCPLPVKTGRGRRKITPSL